MSIAYGVKTVTSGQNTVVNVTDMNTAYAIVANESPYTLLCKVDGTGASKWIHALTVDRIDIGQGFNGNLIFTPVAVLNNTVNAPSYALLVDTYSVGEQPPGTYPIGLTRAVEISNTIPVGTSVLQLQNDGNAAPTFIVEATPSGASASAVLINNDGSMTIKGWNAGVLTTLLDIVASGAVTIGKSGGLTTISGNLTVAGNTTHTGTTTATGTVIAGTVTAPASTDLKLGNNAVDANVLQAVSGGALFIKNASSIQMQVPSGTNVLSLASTGITSTVDITANGQITVANGVNYNVGRIKDINNGSNLSGTINHGLSGTPNAVLATCNTASSSATVGASSYTSTQFTLTIGGGLNGRWVAYR